MAVLRKIIKMDPNDNYLKYHFVKPMSIRWILLAVDIILIIAIMISAAFLLISLL